MQSVGPELKDAETLLGVRLDPKQAAHLLLAKIADHFGLPQAGGALQIPGEISPREPDRAQEIRAETDEVARLRAELSRVQSGAQTLGKIVTRMAQSMEAARIEMIQNGPEAAMQWILNSLPDVSDEAPEDQWDGKETATQWIDRTQAADRAAEVAATGIGNPR